MALLGKLLGSLRNVAKKIFASPCNPRLEEAEGANKEVSSETTKMEVPKVSPPNAKSAVEADIPEEKTAAPKAKSEKRPAKPKKAAHKHSHIPPPPRQEKSWEYKGVSKTAKEWAAQYGVTVSAMRYRLKTTGAPENPGRGFIKEPELYEYNNKKQSIADWAKEIGVSEHSIRWRIKKYGGIEIKHDDTCFAEFEDIKVIEEDGRKKIKADGKIYSVQKFCEEFGVCFGTFYGRLRRGWDIRDAIKSVRVVKRDYKKNPATKAKLWEWNGEKHTVKEWAKIFGVKRAMMRKRLLEHGSPERNTEKQEEYYEKKRESARRWEWNGEIHSVKEWAEIYGCPERTMAGRLARSGSPEAPEKGINRQPKLWEWQGEQHSVEEWAKIVGKSESTMRNRLKTTGNPYLAAEEGAKKRGNPQNLIFGVEKSYTWNGVTKTTSEWAKEYNCSVNAIRKRFKTNGTPEVKPKEHAIAAISHTFTWNGETHTYKEWGKKYGVSGDAMRVRIRRNGTPEPKISLSPSITNPKQDIGSKQVKKEEPKQEEKKNILYGYNGDWKTIQEWAEEYGLPEWKVKNNFAHYGVPDVSIFGKDSETSPQNPVSEIDKAIAEGEAKAKGRKRESIKEWLERIRNEPDDGRPLREILWTPKEESLHTLDNIVV